MDDSDVVMLIRAILASKKDPISLQELKSQQKFFKIKKIFLIKKTKKNNRRVL